MEFYEALSSVYDVVFPMNKDTVQFLMKDLKPAANILDVACGTGNYSIPLGRAGHHVDAVDLDGNMIQLAQKKNKGEDVHFVQGDMTKVKNIFFDQSYDLIFCIGNSIVHLESKEAVAEVILDIYNMLQEKGQMVLQTINYDRIIKYNIDSLPTIESKDEGVTFIRKYFYRADEQKVDFNTQLNICKKDEMQTYLNSVSLLALEKAELESMIERAGFSRIEFYGGFDNKAYAVDSYAMIVRATK